MRTVFLDTSYLLALIRKKDARHEDALAASVNYAGPFITTDLVLVELANCLSQPPYRAAAVAIIEKIRTDGNTMVVPFGSEGMEKALSLYKERPDKSWGLVDCFSFVVIKEKRLKVSLCFDEHFRQAGFETPLL
ncbi:MAG TPA: PIN domain-containing protein [Smithellaceae bacterium]|jgi:uncharacterized protein|nr:PIN domain-containing protein [Smithellaceae bacterium]